MLILTMSMEECWKVGFLDVILIKFIVAMNVLNNESSAMVDLLNFIQCFYDAFHSSGFVVLSSDEIQLG